MKQLIQNLIRDIREADFKNPVVLATTIVFLSIPIVLSVAAYKLGSIKKHDIRAATVKITNRSKTHGGSGVAILSNKQGSWILTNAHVCALVKKGGIITSIHGDSQATSVIESRRSDLCLISIGQQIEHVVNVAEQAPNFYEPAVVSGHPALMPNVISTGHFSGRQVIQVMIGIRPCNEEDKRSSLGLACIIFGGIPVVKNFESILVTATIMPGSSGSGVYNSKEELSGLVFAGSQGFGYGWIVPYDQVLNFLYNEVHSTTPLPVDQLVSFSNDSEESMLDRMESACNSASNKEAVIKQFCDVYKRTRIL